MAAVCHVEFSKFAILIMRPVSARFCLFIPNSALIWQIFAEIGPYSQKLFTRWRTSAILNFQHFDHLSRDPFWNQNLHRQTRFHRNRTIRSWDIQMNFYRATLCVSVVFAGSRCPSVRLSVTLVYCIQTAEDIAKLLYRPGSPIIPVFYPQHRYPIPSAGAQNTPGGKFFDCRLKSPSISETVRDRSIVTMER